MTNKTYTVAEMDRMRRAIEYKWLFGRKLSEPDPNRIKYCHPDGVTTTVGTSTMSRVSDEPEKTKVVEELLRTYMLAGTKPEELE